MVDGIKVYNDDKVTVCIVEEISNELKELIRENLSAICHGAESANRNPRIYSYQRTLKEFLQRYDSKPANTQKGMIGELLSHIILLKHKEEFTSINPFFNMEERSIKKGFDILFIEIESKNKLWITEVKSGNLGQVACSSDKNKELLNKAKTDLSTRLNEDNTQIWFNAIHGASVAVKSNNIRDVVIEILESGLEESLESCFTSIDKNVILTSVLFNDINDEICIGDVVESRNSIVSETIFNDIITLSIQKNTYQAVVQFLKEEIE